MCFNQLKCFSLSFRFNELIAAHVKIMFELFNRSTRNTTQDRRGWGGGGLIGRLSNLLWVRSTLMAIPQLICF
jgi:hypothetical protein